MHTDKRTYKRSLVRNREPTIHANQGLQATCRAFLASQCMPCRCTACMSSYYSSRTSRTLTCSAKGETFTRRDYSVSERLQIPSLHSLACFSSASRADITPVRVGNWTLYRHRDTHTQTRRDPKVLLCSGPHILGEDQGWAGQEERDRPPLPHSRRPW